MTRAIVIRPGERPVVKTISGIKEELDGGWLEAIPFTSECTAFLDEEGKLKKLALNNIATLLCEFYDSGLGFGDVIVGPFVIVGLLNENGQVDGDIHDVPESLVNKITQVYK